MSAPSVEYVILNATSSGALAEAVNNYIREGWRPQGGVACDGGEVPPIFYYQALVREGKQ